MKKLWQFFTICITGAPLWKNEWFYIHMAFIACACGANNELTLSMKILSIIQIFAFIVLFMPFMASLFVVWSNIPDYSKENIQELYDQHIKHLSLKLGF